MSDAKKLYRSSSDRKICGVCGGLAEYLDMDSTVMRVVFLLCMFFGGISLLGYLILALVMPVKK